MRAVSLHRDVIVVTSQLFQAHCTIVRAPTGEEAFAIDSPVLPEELELLASLVQQAGFPEPQGLLATHADWDHVLAPLAFREAALGCAESTVERLRAEPGAAQRALRRFDEELHVERRAPLSLGSVQALAVPGRCSIGDAELELHPTAGHTADGMAICIPWARVLVVGDYLSPIELPVLGEAKADGVGDADGETKANNVGDTLGAYVATLERLRPLVSDAEHVVPGHGPVIDSAAALGVLDEDLAYLQGLHECGVEAELPQARRSHVQRELHVQNATRV